jgi:ketosteroid isomerase-like protein
MDASRSGIAGLDGVYRGPQEAGRFWRGWFEAWESVTFESELVDAGDQVVSLTSNQKLRGRGSGIEVGMSDFGWVMEFRDGKVARATLYMDKRQALEAAGLSE